MGVTTQIVEVVRQAEPTASPLRGGTISAVDLNGKWAQPCPNCVTFAINHEITALDANNYKDSMCSFNIFHLIPHTIPFALLCCTWHEGTFTRLDNSDKFLGASFDKTDTIQFQSNTHAV